MPPLPRQSQIPPQSGSQPPVVLPYQPQPSQSVDPLQFNPYCFRANLSGAQNAAAAVNTTIAFDVRLYDPTRSFDTANHWWKAPVTGYWSFSGAVEVNLQNNPQTWRLFLLVGATDSSSGNEFVVRGGVAGDLWMLVLPETTLFVPQNQTVQLLIFNSGGNVTAITNNNGSRTWFQGRLASKGAGS